MTSSTYQRIGIVGTGRVARAFALALGRLSSAPVHIWGRNADSAAHCASQCGGIAEADLQALARGSDLLVIAVADDAMSDIIPVIGGIPLPHAPFVFHVSGGSGVGVLAPITQAGARTAAIHPAMTFTGNPELEVARMATASFAITGSDDAATQEGFDLVTAMGGHPVNVAEEKRPLYHAALCHASNHLVTLIAGSFLALEKAGVSDPAAFLAPLVQASLDNTLKRGAAALSGPLLRGDTRTVAAHLVAMEQAVPQLVPAYRAMARATLDQMRDRGLTVDEALQALLASA